MPEPTHPGPAAKDGGSMTSRALAMVWLADLCVSTASIFVRWSTAPSLVMAAYRKTFVTLMLLPVVLLRRESRRELFSLDRRTVLWCVLSGIFLAIHFWTYFLSVNYTTVAASQVLVGTEVLFVALFMALTGREHYGLFSKLGILVAFLGSILVTYTPGGLRGGGMMFGNLCGIVSAIVLSGYSLIGKGVRARVSNSVYTFLVYGISALVLDLMVAISPFHFTGYGRINYLTGLGMAVFCTLLGHSIFNWSFQYLSPTLVSITKLFQPMFSMTFAYFLLHELPTLNQLLGGIVVLLGIFLYIRHKPET